MKMFFLFMQIKLIFICKVLHINLVLKVIVFGTRNWPIGFPKAWFPFDPLYRLDYPSCIKKVQDKQDVRMIGDFHIIAFMVSKTGGAWSSVTFLGLTMENHLLHNLREKTDPFLRRKSK